MKSRRKQTTLDQRLGRHSTSARSKKPVMKDDKKGTRATQRKTDHASNKRKRNLKNNRVIYREDEIFKVGDDVYILLDEKLLEPGAAVNQEVDSTNVCKVCKQLPKERQVLLECGKCLDAYHLHCIEDSPEEVPEGIWICKACRSGQRRRTRRALTSAREHVLQQAGLGLGRIQCISYDSKLDEQFIQCRWYCLPEETHIGRQNHHTAREVFLSSHKNTVSAETIYGRAHVITLSEYGEDGIIDDDMFVCDYEYDHHWKRFYRLTEWDDKPDAVAAADISDDEELDATFTMVDALTMSADMKSRISKKKRKYQGGGTERALQLGSHDILVDRLEKETNLSRAGKALSLNTIPSFLPRREKEIGEIRDFIDQVLSIRGKKACGPGKCLYISGIPGTGKTASVLDVIRSFSQSADADKKGFHFVEINGLQLPSPQHVYSKLYEALTGESIAPKAAAGALNDIFSGKSRKFSTTKHHIIVLLDEMDSLVNRSEKILYNFFDWPGKSTSNLSIIGIANTMDLPERLHARIGSRLAGSRVVFHPYQREDLEVIMRTRLEGCPIFEKNAVTLAARKVANCSGDVRRCLELCRRAVEIALINGKGKQDGLKVMIRDVDQAIKEAYSTPHIKMLESCTKTQLLTLMAIHLESFYAGQYEVTIDSLADRLNSLLPGTKIPFPTVLQSVYNLSNCRLLSCDGSKDRMKSKVTLNISTDDMSYIANNHPDRDIKNLARRLQQ